ncbi:hypothetical protein AXF21_03835 [Eubacterium minutum ATCC 700079]|nr:hypothetical protein AXF21_03835 [Eubacterium minutum ATCC 700079]
MKKTGKIIIVIAIVAIAVVAVKIGPSVMDYFLNSSKTTKIGFEDIAELDTQVAYCNVIGVVNDSKKVFGKELPFTRSKYIYSYNVVVKAGLNFKEISWEKSGEKIKVQMPKMHVTDSYIDEKSGKVYHEEESIFSPVTFSENMRARKDLVKRGVDDAIANGLYRNAKKNAEVIMKSFFRQHGEYKDKDIVFEWKK